jgi:polysaccharide deacetylase family protein (PEP-CTERM system associated)
MTYNKINILTFDIEDWFHLLDHDATKNQNSWGQYESRIHSNMDRIFQVLESTNQKATFFCMGWMAKTYPEVIREIITRGYEIGSHSNFHQLVYEQSPKEFKSDLECSVKTIEDIIGQKVLYYRAPGFSITEQNKWAFEILHEQGIEIDCSVFPAARSHGGFPSFNIQEPALIKYNGITIKELPINYHSVLSKPIIYSGGGYFRLIPYFIIKKWSKKSNYVMTYFHPRDFDAHQPMIHDLSLSRKFKSYVGLKGVTQKLDTWLKEEEFIDISTANSVVNWERVPIVNL